MVILFNVEVFARRLCFCFCFIYYIWSDGIMSCKPTLYPIDYSDFWYMYKAKYEQNFNILLCYPPTVISTLYKTKKEKKNTLFSMVTISCEWNVGELVYFTEIFCKYVTICRKSVCKHSIFITTYYVWPKQIFVLFSLKINLWKFWH